MNSIRIVALALALATMMLALGCSTNASGANPDASTPTSGDGGTASGGASISCAAIIDCIYQCADADTRCPDACAAKGSPDAQTAVTAFAVCIDKAACKDEGCVETNCGAEAKACFAPPPPNGSPNPPGDTPALGSIAAELQGEWASFGELWAFTADGTFAHIIKLKGGPSWSETGIAVTSGNTIRIIIKAEPEKDFTYTVESAATTGTGADKLVLDSGGGRSDGYDRIK